MSLLLLLASFSLTRIYDGLEGRFVLFVLLLVPVAFRDLDRAKAFGVLTVVLCIGPMLVARSIKWTFVMHRPPAVQQGRVGIGLVPLGAELSRLPNAGTAVVIDGYLLVHPLVYEDPEEASHSGS
jgi:hypothetical protein